jgi:hypothetical protein
MGSSRGTLPFSFEENLLIGAMESMARWRKEKGGRRSEQLGGGDERWGLHPSSFMSRGM